DRYKLLAFVLSASFAGLAGATKAIVFQLASLTDVHWTMSGEAVLMTLVGGLGTVFGPVVGAVIIVGMQNYLASFGEWVTVTQGVRFVFCVLLCLRAGIGEIATRVRTKLGPARPGETSVEGRSPPQAARTGAAQRAVAGRELRAVPARRGPAVSLRTGPARRPGQGAHRQGRRRRHRRGGLPARAGHRAAAALDHPPGARLARPGRGGAERARHGERRAGVQGPS